MQSRGLVPLFQRHPVAGRDNRSLIAGLGALALGAFLAGGWMAAIGVLFVVRLGQALLKAFGRTGGPGGSGTLGLV
jgi:hypothetical protein